jgi:protein gp37
VPLGPRRWPRNAAIGCTVVTQEEADRDIPKLLAAKAALNPAFAFVSMEPLLGPVDLTRIRGDEDEITDVLRGEFWTSRYQDEPHTEQHLDWVITGGETDQGAHKARPSHPDWFRSLRDQCAAAGVAYHHKQNGEWGHCPDRSAIPDHVFRVGKKAAGRLLDAVTHDARPEARQ